MNQPEISNHSLKEPSISANASSVNHQIIAYQNNLRRLASEISLAEAKERRAIASDLHDHLGQALAYVKQKVAIMQSNATFSGMEDDISDVLTILDQSIRYVRNLTVEISPPILYELGLPATIDWLAERITKRHKITTRVNHTGVPQDVSEAIRVFIFKAIQELLNNAIKHAEPKTIDIQCQWGYNELTMTVTDDGKGFDVENYTKVDSESCCFGLFSIKERLSYIGGSMSIESSLGYGTRVTITSPYQLPRVSHT